MKKNLLYGLLFALFASTACAKVRLPDILSNNMVLQQNTQVKLWGKARANMPVSVKTSWESKTYTAHSDVDGRWILTVTTPKAGYTPQTIQFTEGEKTVLSNILIGEVWFCSGQSNMEMPLNGFRNCPVLGANESIANASQYKGSIRFATIPKTAALTPQDTCGGKWQECIPEKAQGFSAAAFHFATALHTALNIPVGIINCSWGGSTVEGWLPENILKNYPDIDLKQAGSKEGLQFMQPMIMYNGMLKPLENYTIKGFLWYQGESNVGKQSTYADRLATMVNLWRNEWGLGELPFYFVEIAPYEYGKGDQGAYLREAQFKAQALIPSSGMISTNDLVEPYEATNIHPHNKTLVGQRLCYMALSRTYGMKGISDHGPVYRSMEIKDGKAVLTFDNADNGFGRMNGITGFEIAGADKVFHPATAVSDWNQHIIVSSNEVAQPVAVRYGFRNFLPGNLYNHREQPAYPFRTDNWE
ncbi:sialate O-acetylesterase [uncultured Bacteroides sp.]|uniref:sialate O-acetylesterase n=1 Tax=uncultured Bacteroides sp. TaxID=162156 RepID=UPI002AA6CE9F|nr:sialate O-acetylesterase [uncultured Bacteroides sp.]